MSAFDNLRAARAPLAAFAAMGVLWGCFAAVLPDLMRMLGVDERTLGLLMFLTPVAAVLAMLAAPAIGHALGRVALPVATLAMCAGFVLPGQAWAPWVFPFFMLACGAGTGLTDVLMNARVAAIEAAQGRSLMNLAHAGYSFGYAGGAIATGLLREAGWPPAWVLGSMALTAAALGLLTVERDGRIKGLKRPAGAGSGGLGLVPLIGGAMVLIAFLTENAAENWSALHIEQTLGASPSGGALGPAVLALTMGFARLAGQAVLARVSPLRVLTVGAAIAGLGALGAALAPTPGFAYAAFIVMGLGASVIAPTTFSLVSALAAPEARARAIARATLLGYFGYFVGPPSLGLIAGTFGLRAAFVWAALLLMLVPVLARLMARRV